MKFAFISAQEVAFPIQSMCEVLGVSRSGYYAWKDRPPAGADPKTVALTAEITAAHGRSRGHYDSPRIHRELRARGIRVGRKRIERLMRERGLKGARRSADSIAPPTRVIPCPSPPIYSTATLTRPKRIESGRVM